MTTRSVLDVEEEEDELLRPYVPPAPPKPADDMVSILEAVTEMRMHPPGELSIAELTDILSRALKRNGYKFKEPVEEVPAAPAKKAKTSAQKKAKTDT